jgi:hypothetical protein
VRERDGAVTEDDVELGPKGCTGASWERCRLFWLHCTATVIIKVLFRSPVLWLVRIFDLVEIK